MPLGLKVFVEWQKNAGAPVGTPVNPNNQTNLLRLKQPSHSGKPAADTHKRGHRGFRRLIRAECSLNLKKESPLLPLVFPFSELLINGEAGFLGVGDRERLEVGGGAEAGDDF